MQAASAPTPITTPFAASAGAAYLTAPIPVASQQTVPGGAGRASYTDGFPPLCFIPQSLGGIPPDGRDLNGILNQISAGLAWLQAGAWPAYSSAYSALIGGYPLGSILADATRTGFWISTVDGNTTNPDTGGAGWNALIPGSVMPATHTVAGISKLSTQAQAQAGTDDTTAVTPLSLSAAIAQIILDNLADVAISNPISGQVLAFNGASWVNTMPNVQTTITQTSVSVTQTSSQLIAANSSRKYLRFEVVGANDVTISPGTSSAVFGTGLIYQAQAVNKQGSGETFDAVVPTGAFQCICASGNSSSVIVWEGV